MLINSALLIFGLFFLIKGARALIDGAVAVAKKFNLSDLMIGLTVVAFGTSMPELMVNIFANITGSTDIGIGNLIGSSITDILFITGIVATIGAIKIRNSTAWKEIPLGLSVILLVFLLANDVLLNRNGMAIIGRGDGLILILFFFIFLYYTFGINKIKGEENLSYQSLPLKTSWIFIVIGMAGLYIGSYMTVTGASAIAKIAGVSEAFIGLTIISIGTSLPELVTATTAAMKKSADIAIGNIIGSIVFKLSFVLGINALIKPIHFNLNFNFNLLIALASTLLLYYFILAGKKRGYIERWEGIGLICAYLVYIVFLVWLE